MVASPNRREPWRTFESSLAIQFVSDRHRVWAPGAAGFDKQAVLSAILARQSAARARARLKSALFDFVRDATAVPDYAHFPFKYRSDDELRSLARAIVIAPGPCSAHRDRLLPLLMWLDESGPELELFLGGFVEVREKRSGKVEFLFELFRARRRLRPFEVESRALELCAVFDDAVGRVSAASEQVKASLPSSP